MGIDLTRRLQLVLGPIIATSLLGYFIYHIIQGERGLLSWRQLNQKIERAENRFKEVQKEQERLERRVRLMRPESLDPDMLEEEVRKKLNFVGKDEIVVQDNELLEIGTD
jgi:cell division protein FtsB